MIEMSVLQRHWQFTIDKMPNKHLKSPQMRYFMYGTHNKTMIVHGYVQLIKPQRESFLKKWLPNAKFTSLDLSPSTPVMEIIKDTNIYSNQCQMGTPVVSEPKYLITDEITLAGTSLRDFLGRK